MQKWIFAQHTCYALQKQSIFAFQHFALKFCKQNVSSQKCIWCQNAMFFALQKVKMRTFCWCWTFSKGKCSAMLAKMHLMQKCICVLHFVDAKMHLMQKCIWCKNAFLRTFSSGKCSAYIFQRKMFSNTKILESVQNAFCVHFPKDKCFASHFPKENVQLCLQNVTNAFLLCKNVSCKNALCTNAFDAKMHFCATFSKGKCSVSILFWNVINVFGAVRKCICKNAFDAKMHLRCKNAFLQRNEYIFLQDQMHFATTKCYKCIWCRSHFQSKMFDAKMHLMPKCILAYIFQRKMFSNAVQKCIWCVHFVTQNVTNAFDLHFVTQNVTNSNVAKFKVQMFASHFPKENVQHHILQSQMFSITFSKGKCSASHLTL